MTKMLAGALAYLARTKVKNLVYSLFSKGFEKDGGAGEGKTFAKKFSLPPQKNAFIYSSFPSTKRWRYSSGVMRMARGLEPSGAETMPSDCIRSISLAARL